MNMTTTQKLARFPGKFLQKLRGHTNAIYTAVIVLALAAFEIFNFSSTDFALRDMLGSQGTYLLSWSAILSLAFCGMDFAGIARLLTMDAYADREPGGWYLLGAWVLSGAMNAGLTWWAVSLAVYNHPVENILLIDPMTYVAVIPVVVALMVWVIRILIIGTLATALNESLGGKPARKKPAKKSVFGFQANNRKVPAGFTPMPEGARAQNQNHF